MLSKVEQQLYAFNELELIKHIVKPGLKWICTTCTGLTGKTWTRQKSTKVIHFLSGQIVYNRTFAGVHSGLYLIIKHLLVKDAKEIDSYM